MTVSKGEIWLANLNPIKKNNEVGKVRPVYILQTNELNHSDYPTTIVLPLTTVLVDDAEPLRMRVTKREKLQQNSDILIAQVRAIDNSRFAERLSVSNDEEMKRVKRLFDEVLE
ncbi:MAG: type II toxin-antitoxin system PemK/MazF family toxin [Sulfurovum sp.]|nr:type II toxin-antitoxin system PemK/MazF family toxin [Sulfurovum sp.]